MFSFSTTFPCLHAPVAIPKDGELCLNSVRDGIFCWELTCKFIGQEKTNTQIQQQLTREPVRDSYIVHMRFALVGITVVGPCALLFPVPCYAMAVSRYNQIEESVYHQSKGNHEDISVHSSNTQKCLAWYCKYLLSTYLDLICPM